MMHSYQLPWKAVGRGPLELSNLKADHVTPVFTPVLWPVHWLLGQHNLAKLYNSKGSINMDIFR